MDYKYVECLLERYFECETTTQEERILREFFMQDDVPAHLQDYKPLFEALDAEQGTELPASFDARLQQRLADMETERKSTSPFFARLRKVNHSLTPMYKAVASIALVITAGVSSSIYWNSKEPEPVEYNYAKYHDTYTDPQVAYEQMSSALQGFSKAFKASGVILADNDSTTTEIATKVAQ